jgi:hypothetical protein
MRLNVNVALYSDHRPIQQYNSTLSDVQSMTFRTYLRINQTTTNILPKTLYTASTTKGIAR